MISEITRDFEKYDWNFYSYAIFQKRFTLGLNYSDYFVKKHIKLYFSFEYCKGYHICKSLYSVLNRFSCMKIIM